MDDFGLPNPVIPPTPPPVPQPEAPVIVTPKKKFPLKLVAGALMMLLLIGGAYLGVSEVQKRQTAEQQASNINSCDDYGDPKKRQACKDGYIKPGQKPEDCPDKQWALDPDYGHIKAFKACCELIAGGEVRPGTVYDPNPGSGSAGGDENELYCDTGRLRRSPNPSPTPSPSPDVSPGPSPSPVVGLACVDLTKDTAAPKVGDAVTFTCESSAATGMSPVAFFRYSTDNGVNFSGAVPVAGIGVNPTTHKASYDITIDKTGDWEVQCRVCTDSGTPGCTDWGQALTTLTH